MDLLKRLKIIDNTIVHDYINYYMYLRTMEDHNKADKFLFLLNFIMNVYYPHNKKYEKKYQWLINKIDFRRNYQHAEYILDNDFVVFLITMKRTLFLLINNIYNVFDIDKTNDIEYLENYFGVKCYKYYSIIKI